jgi:hypothetical protein
MLLFTTYPVVKGFGVHVSNVSDMFYLYHLSSGQGVHVSNVSDMFVYHLSSGQGVHVSNVSDMFIFTTYPVAKGFMFLTCLICLC